MVPMTDDAAGPVLPPGHTAYPPGPEDVDDLVRLLRRHEREAMLLALLGDLY